MQYGGNTDCSKKVINGEHVKHNLETVSPRILYCILFV